MTYINPEHREIFKLTLKESKSIKLLCETFIEAKALRQSLYNTKRKIIKKGNDPLALVLDEIEMSVKNSTLQLNKRSNSNVKFKRN